MADIVIEFAALTILTLAPAVRLRHAGAPALELISTCPSVPSSENNTPPALACTTPLLRIVVRLPPKDALPVTVRVPVVTDVGLKWTVIVGVAPVVNVFTPSPNTLTFNPTGRTTLVSSVVNCCTIPTADIPNGNQNGALLFLRTSIHSERLVGLSQNVPTLKFL